MKYTLDTDFSSLNGPKAANWIMGFQDMAEDAFADSSSHSRLLGNLLILEPYLHTIRQGLADRCRTVPAILQEALDILWDYLEGRKAPSDFQDFANNLYAAALDYNVGGRNNRCTGGIFQEICRHSLGEKQCMADTHMAFCPFDGSGCNQWWTAGF